MSDDTSVHVGSCRCGQVQLKVRGRPLMTMACHCTGCQKMTASAFSLSALYALDAVEVHGLEPVIGGMHGEMHHNFCPYCLSWIFTRAKMLGPMINVRATMLDNAAELSPFIETCADEKLPWASTPAVHSYGKYPSMEAFPLLLQEFAAAAT